MTYSDTLDKLGQIKMTNMNIIRSQIPPVKGDLVAQNRKDRDDARNRKKNKINLRKQQDQIKADEEKNLKDASDYYRGKDPNAKVYNKDGQEVLNDGSIIRDEDIRTNGPIIDPNTLLQIGGAAGGLLKLLINPLGGRQLAQGFVRNVGEPVGVRSYVEAMKIIDETEPHPLKKQLKLLRLQRSNPLDPSIGGV